MGNSKLNALLPLITMLFFDVKLLSQTVAVLIYPSVLYIPFVVIMGTDDISELVTETSVGPVRIRIITMENGLLILFTEKSQYRLGISAVAIPPGTGRSAPTSTAQFTVGLDTTLVRTIAERIAAWTNSSCMVVSGLVQLNRELMMEILSFLKDHFVA